MRRQWEGIIDFRQVTRGGGSRVQSAQITLNFDLPMGVVPAARTPPMPYSTLLHGNKATKRALGSILLGVHTVRVWGKHDGKWEVQAERRVDDYADVFRWISWQRWYAKKWFGAECLAIEKVRA